MVLPSPEEWDSLCKGTISHIGGAPVLDADILRMSIRGATEQGAHSTDHVEAFLELPQWHKVKRWWPVLYYWPTGKPSLECLISSG